MRAHGALDGRVLLGLVHLVGQLDGHLDHLAALGGLHAGLEAGVALADEVAGEAPGREAPAVVVDHVLGEDQREHRAGGRAELRGRVDHAHRGRQLLREELGGVLHARPRRDAGAALVEGRAPRPAGRGAFAMSRRGAGTSQPASATAKPRDRARSGISEGR